jgi:hypothetical protein
VGFFHAAWRAAAIALAAAFKGLPPDVTLLVGDLHDSGHYKADDGVSAATLVELYRLCRWACHMDFYLSPRRGNVPPATIATAGELIVRDPEPSTFVLAVLAFGFAFRRRYSTNGSTHCSP